MRHINETESTRTSSTPRLQTVHAAVEMRQRKPVEPKPVNEDRWREAQLEEPERWDGMS